MGPLGDHALLGRYGLAHSTNGPRNVGNARVRLALARQLNSKRIPEGCAAWPAGHETVRVMEDVRPDEQFVGTAPTPAKTCNCWNPHETRVDREALAELRDRQVSYAGDGRAGGRTEL